MINLHLELLEVASTFLRVRSRATNRSPETPVHVFSELSSFIVVGKSGQIPWRFVGLSGGSRPKILVAQSDVFWETILPISPKFDSLGAAHPGFLELRSESYTLQLICDLEWELPTNWFSEPVQAAVLGNEFAATVESNVVTFQVLELK